MHYKTDELMLSLHETLLHDLRRNLGLAECYDSSVFTARTPAQIRDSSLILHEGLSAYEFKCFAQVNAFLKRYTFQNDLYSPEKREELTNAKFIKLQETLAISYWRPRTMRCHQVLRLARKIVSGILGKVELKTLTHEGRFGTKSTVGCPRAEAYVDTKLLDKPITGSAAHIQWFKEVVLPADPLLADIVSKNKHGYETIDCLQQVNVPKNYKIDRGINPNTLIGSYYTDVLGKLVVQALKLEGLNIRKLQRVHGRLAMRASRNNTDRRPNRKLVTADLSDASHGFLSSILNAMLPREWYRACMKGAIRKVEVNGQIHRLESIMTMGIGFTFPMQTLLFYCLLKAISILTSINGTISVYGDDLIYPQAMHPFVVGIFEDLGFKLNLDKTFVDSHFKESCGTDVFKGVDVRPYSPEGKSATLGKSKYGAFCYQLVNGLLQRWNYWEVENTVNSLLFEIMFSLGSVFVVPADYPETAGIRADTIPSRILDYFVVERWTWDETTFSYVFPILSSKIARRYVSDTQPYYWDWLRINSHREFTSDLLAPIIGAPIFKWRKARPLRTYVGKCGWKIVKCIPTVSSKEGELVAWYEVQRPSAKRAIAVLP